MVQKTVVIYTDDLTGKESEEVQTYEFTLNGVAYEIDLAPESYDQMLDDFGPYMEKGRKTGRVKGAQPKAKAGGPSASDMRAWATENGYEVSPRGRVPAGVREAYEAAH
ncbi:histone-like nucleoid-structuring protein Lsr2 [Streptomyces sp. OK228]|uniref:histone-like nucleoid-structuring protein Lsr2 n=1 Tax=Streptomyces sp. OK228 TaxID=1882786 RepID=UPI000BD1C733|nr:Lsr2 family protein [Streptomyces sp. OK228]SOE25606.1 Lsr2 protein [Streptomyces sp. OK228]